MDLLLMNLKLAGVIQHDLSSLVMYARQAARACHVPIPRFYPLVGEDAFRTATGVHAAAVVKAARKGESWLADRIYSGVPASMFGCGQTIEIGPMSGASNVNWWLVQHGYSPDEALVGALLALAKRSDRVLNDEEVLFAVRQHRLKKEEPSGSSTARNERA
jgi:2-isopropylmalate synthase